MAELDVIIETLRRQREDLEGLQDETLSRSSETAKLIDRIEDLRVRSEKTMQRARSQPEESRPNKR